MTMEQTVAITKLTQQHAGIQIGNDTLGGALIVSIDNVAYWVVCADGQLSGPWTRKDCRLPKVTE